MRGVCCSKEERNKIKIRESFEEEEKERNEARVFPILLHPSHNEETPERPLLRTFNLYINFVAKWLQLQPHGYKLPSQN